MRTNLTVLPLLAAASGLALCSCSSSSSAVGTQQKDGGAETAASGGGPHGEAATDTDAGIDAEASVGADSTSHGEASVGSDAGIDSPSHSDASGTKCPVKTSSCSATDVVFDATQVLPYSTWSEGPTAIAAADLNCDGITDLVALAKDGSGNDVQVLIGNGDGTFKAPVGYADTAPGDALTVALGDFDGDGTIDILNLEGGGDPVAAFYAGVGDGTFNLPIELDLTPAWVSNTSFVVADFNHDGLLDFAISGPIVFLNNGSKAPGTAPFDTGTSYVATIGGEGGLGDLTSVADLNGDGFPDLLAPSITGSGTATQVCYALSSAGSFSTSTCLPDRATMLVNQVVAADVNGDGLPDIVEFGSSDTEAPPEIDVRLNKGVVSGMLTFATPVPYSAPGLVGVGPYGNFSTQGAVLDTNNDGKPDLIEYNMGTINVILNTGNGEFGSTASTYSVGAANSCLQSFAWGDFNGTGLTSLAVVNGSPAGVELVTATCSQ